jgi:hypothetical protein
VAPLCGFCWAHQSLLGAFPPQLGGDASVDIPQMLDCFPKNFEMTQTITIFVPYPVYLKTLGEPLLVTGNGSQLDPASPE